MPALIFATALNFLLAFESFGLPLILGDPGGVLVLTTYIYKLTTLMGVPSYHLMAVVAVVLLAITFPLVWLQRRLLARARRYATVGGKGARVTPIRLGSTMQLVCWLAIGAWLAVSVLLPVGGITVRAFVDSWGEGVDLTQHLTLANFHELLTAAQRCAEFAISLAEGRRWICSTGLDIRSGCHCGTGAACRRAIETCMHGQHRSRPCEWPLAAYWRGCRQPSR